MFNRLIIENPKRTWKKHIGRASWYPYYAGFSDNFAYALLQSAGLAEYATIIDPWNGSGTTTSAAAELGFRANGYDLNPVMVITAKARLLNKREKPSILPLVGEIITKSMRADSVNIDGDPLCTWLTRGSASGIRQIERAIQILLIDGLASKFLKTNADLCKLSDIAAFFYTALFRTVRSALKRFMVSNPTWVKRPRRSSDRLQSSLETTAAIFRSEVETMTASIEENTLDAKRASEDVYINMASSDALPISDSSVDFVLSSPPYCTRIDYAISTMPELALLGYAIDGDFRDLRKRLIGTSTVPASPPTRSPDWGQTCIRFLEELECHNSKASKSYYLKNHIQYFDAIFRSIAEITRILVSGGRCVLVVQDSYYKEVHNNLPLIVIEMANGHGLELDRRMDFRHKRTMAGIHPRVKQYRSRFDATESVLCFIK